MPVDLVRIGSNWWHLAKRKDGTPIYSQSPIPFFPPQVAQSDVTEAQLPPESRSPYSFRDLSEGGGQAETPVLGLAKGFDRIGEAEGEGIDPTLTPKGPMIMAALLNTQTHPTAGTSNLLGALWKGGTNTAYFAQGRYVYSWDGVTFTQVGDLGAGNAATDGLNLFRGVQTADTWYAPLGYSSSEPITSA